MAVAVNSASERKIEKQVVDGKEWLVDDHKNRASIDRWGSEEAAIAALNSLDSRCSGCSDCYRCSDCSGCSGCSDCSHCFDCYRCSDCSGCSDCSHCSDCSGCSDCYRCSGCSDCSRCSGCSGCYRCSPQKAEPSAVPKIENIHQKIYTAASQPNALNMCQWHTCETTHCRAGWVVHLAGEAGYKLEKKTSPVFAAMQIYEASGYLISPCRFFDSNTEAMADMKRLAEMQDAV